MNREDRRWKERHRGGEEYATARLFGVLVLVVMAVAIGVAVSAAMVNVR